MTKLQFRVLELSSATIMMLMAGGLVHLITDEPFMSDFTAGGVFAILVLRGIDVMRAATNQWPEND
jgi:hypothetical protein